MYIVVIAWLYVALMMGVAEALHPAGTVLGGIITFVLYGAGPVALVAYVLHTPTRRQAARDREARGQPSQEEREEPVTEPTIPGPTTPEPPRPASGQAHAPEPRRRA